MNINNDTAHASWYDDDPAWQYRQKFTINNPAGSAVSNYQFLINEGELARWKFDENANSTIGDDAGYDMDGTITGLGSGITWTTSGKYTNALSFDGTDTNFVDMGNPTLLNPTSNYITLSAWVKTSSSSHMRIISKGLYNNSTGYMIEMNDGYVYTGMGSGSESTSVVFSSSSNGFNDDTWHHISATFDHANAQGYLYIDGAAVEIVKPNINNCGSVSSSTRLDYSSCYANISAVSTSNFYIGRYDGSALYPWNGLIDEVRIYNKTLSSSDIDYLYDNNASPLLRSHLYSNVIESGADLRFTTSDASTNIPYYIEKFTKAGQNARIWLKFSSLASGNSDIYIYYGKSSSGGASNIATTFDNYDDFGNESIGGLWNTQSGNGTITESSSGTLDFSYSGTDTDWWSDGRETVALELASPPTTDFWAQIKLNSYTVNASTQAGIAVYEDDANVYLFGREHDGTNNRYSLDIIGNYSIASFASTGLPSYLGIQKESGGFSFWLSYENFVWQKIGSTYNDIDVNHIVLFGKSWNSNSLSFSLDDFFTRKTVSSVPTIAINGSNEAFEYILEFTIEGVSSGSTNNGVTTSVATSYNLIDYGKLDFGDAKYAAQKLTVKSSATRGYTVTVEMDGYMQGLYPANKIDPFGVTDVSWTTPKSWSEPDGTEPNSDSGWIGANTSDTRVTGWTSGTSGKFGPISSTEHTVMYCDDQDGGTSAYVSYALEVNQLKPADNYAGQLVYSIVPTY